MVTFELASKNNIQQINCVMEEKELTKNKIPYILVGNKKYFQLESIRLKFGDVKTKSAIVVDNKRYALAENIEKYTEFDKSIKKILNLKVKK